MRRDDRRRGFTLTEVLIVLVLVLAIGGLVAYNLFGKKDEADLKLVRIQMQQIERGLKEFRVAHGRYPTDDEGIRVLWDKEALTDEDAQKSWSKMLEKPLPKDKWGSDWGYRQKSEHGDEEMYDLWSVGPDKQEGTKDDIVSWDAEDGDTGTASDGKSKGG